MLTIEFNGTMEEWKAILANSASDWHNGLRPGSIVRCTDGYFVQEGKEYSVLGITYISSYKWVEYSY